MSANQQAAAFGAGRFVGGRHGPMSRAEVEQIVAHRSRPRPTPWQALSMMYGRPVEDLRALADDAAGLEPKIVAFTPTNDLMTARERRFSTLWKEGVSVSDICRMLGIGKATMTNMRVRLGLEPRCGGRPTTAWTEEQDAELRRLFIIEGRSASEVGRILGFSRCAVTSRAGRKGWLRRKSEVEAL